MERLDTAEAIVFEDLSRPAPDLVLDALETHAVLRLLPEAARNLVAEAGEVRRLEAGSRLRAAPGIAFVLSGVLAAFDRKELAAVTLHGPDTLFGLEAALAHAAADHSLLAMTDAVWIAVPAAEMLERMGPTWIEHVFARQALDRLERLHAQLACTAVHPVGSRAANWIRRLDALCPGEIRTTQALLAEAMGVQRTSVNAAVKALESEGVLRVSRGRLTVTDPLRLARLSCGC